MEVAKYVIPYSSKSDQFRIHPIGDIHLGTQHCAESKIKERIKEIKDDQFAYWVGLGDYAEFIAPSDKRWDGSVISDWVHPDNIAEDQTRAVVELFKPIKDKCIGLVLGNHEETMRLRLHTNVQQNICDRLGVKNLGYSSYIKLIFKRLDVEGREMLGIVSHGAGCAITKGAKLTRLERFMDSFNARWYAHGHTHDIITNEKHYLDLTSTGKIVSKNKVGAMTGCWFKTYSQGIAPSYGEQKNYPPTSLGAPVFEFTPYHDELKAIA